MKKDHTFIKEIRRIYRKDWKNINILDYSKVMFWDESIKPMLAGIVIFLVAIGLGTRNLLLGVAYLLFYTIILILQAGYSSVRKEKRVKAEITNTLTGF